MLCPKNLEVNILAHKEHGPIGPGSIGTDKLNLDYLNLLQCEFWETYVPLHVININF